MINGSESCTSFKQALSFKELGFRLHDTMIYEKLSGLPLNHNRYEQKFEYMFVLSKGTPSRFNPLLEKTVGFGRVSKAGSVNGASKDEKNANSGGWGYGELTKEHKIKSNVWKYQTGHGHSTLDASAFEHPATFPEALARDHIVSWSNEGDLVLDPFLGSGTTAKMAHNLKRNYIGIDISEEYCEIARKRIAGQSLPIL